MSSPVLVVGPTDCWVFVRGYDNRIWMTKAAIGPAQWQPLPAAVTSDISVFQYDDPVTSPDGYTFALAGIGLDGQAWVMDGADFAGSPVQSQAWSPIGGRFAYAPTFDYDSVTPSYEPTCVTGVGLDRAAWYECGDGWTSTGGYFTSPVTTVDGVTVGRGGDGAMWMSVDDGPWRSLGGQFTEGAMPSIRAVAGGYRIAALAAGRDWATTLDPDSFDAPAASWSLWG